MPPTERNLQPARLGQRFLAGLIDSGGAIGLFGGVVAAAAEEWRPNALDRLRGLSRGAQRLLDWTNSPRGRQANRAVTVVWGVTMRNAHTPGMRVAHIRRVDARTGGPVTVRSALRGAAFQLVWSIGAKRVMQPKFDRMEAAAKESSEQLAEVRRSHPDDPQAEAAFYSSQRRGPFVGCCGTLLALFAIQGLPVALTRRRQNLFEWVAGTMLVRD